MIGLYIPEQSKDAKKPIKYPCWLGTVEELWSEIRTYYRTSPFHIMHHAVIDELEYLILQDVEKDFPDHDFAEHPLVAARSSSGWSGRLLY